MKNTSYEMPATELSLSLTRESSQAPDDNMDTLQTSVR